MTDKQQPVAWAVYKGDECLRVHEKREWAEDWARAEAHFGSVGPYHIRELFAAPPAQPDHQGHSCTHKCTWPQCEAAQPAPAQEPQPVSNTDELPQRLSDERDAFEAWMSEDGQFPKAIERDRNGNYLLSTAANAWRVWQAAIESALQTKATK